MNANAISIVHNAAAGRFEAVIDGQHCIAAYTLANGTMRMTHTEVPRALEGRGIAAALVRAALAHARERGLKVAPLCSYVRAYMRRHAEVQDLLAEGYRV